MADCNPPTASSPAVFQAQLDVHDVLTHATIPVLERWTIGDHDDRDALANVLVAALRRLHRLAVCEANTPGAAE